MGTLMSYKGHSIQGESVKIPEFTQAEWDALSDSEKKKLDIVYITDDMAAGGAIVVDEVEEGNYNSVSSNAVAKTLQGEYTTTTETLSSSDYIIGSSSNAATISRVSLVKHASIGNLEFLTFIVDFSSTGIIEFTINTNKWIKSTMQHNFHWNSYAGYLDSGDIYSIDYGNSLLFYGERKSSNSSLVINVIGIKE